MRIISKLILCLCILPVSVLCQEQIVKNMAGPNGDQFRTLVSFVYVSDDSYKMQSVIIDTDRVKNKKETPSIFLVDLTTTVRSLATGQKKQKILVLRWERSGDVEVKCEDGKWAKQTPGSELDNILKMVTELLQKAPLDAKDPVEFSLPKDLEQKITSILNGLETSTLKCVREGS